MSMEFEDQRRAALMATVDQIRYTETILSSEDYLQFNFYPESLTVPKVTPNHPFYNDHWEPFNLERYQYPRPPICLGHSLLHMTNVDNVLRMPIKYPMTQYKIPIELAAYWDLIKRVAEYESGFNIRHEEMFVHITIDRSHVKANTSHRYPGFHGDGVQGTKFSQDQYLPIEHSYIMTSEPPTEFCIQPFFLNHLNDARNNIFHEFEVQARESNIYGTIPWHLYLIDPYMVHRTPTITKDTDRLFVRITYTYSELMNPHNTKSPLFPEHQNYDKRHDIRKFLTTYPDDVPWGMYGLSYGPKRSEVIK